MRFFVCSCALAHGKKYWWMSLLHTTGMNIILFIFVSFLFFWFCMPLVLLLKKKSKWNILWKSKLKTWNIKQQQQQQLLVLLRFDCMWTVWYKMWVNIFLQHCSRWYKLNIWVFVYTYLCLFVLNVHFM